MADEGGDPRPEAPESSGWGGDPRSEAPGSSGWGGDPRSPVPGPSAWGGEALVEYADDNLDAYTPEALEAAIVAAGHDPADARTAVDLAKARRAARPLKRRAGAIAVVAYVLTYLMLAVGLMQADLPYGASPLAVVVLTVAMLIAGGIATWWLRRPDAPITLLPLLFIPLIVLIGVGGACYATTGGAPIDGLQELLKIAPSAPPGP